MSMSVPAILKYLHNSSSSNEDDYDNVLADMENNDNPGRSKKRRLDHLTWEEKIQRKKLKNRVAAQTSRDRKKAKMEQMETAIRELFDKNEQLISECEKLRTLNEKLQLENQELHGRLTAPCASCAQQQQQRQHQSRPVECLGRNGPAASTFCPQPKGPVIHSAAALSAAAAARAHPRSQQQRAALLLKIVLACLLYRTSSTNSTAMSISPLSKRSRRASFRISPQTWRLLLRRQIAKYVIRSKYIAEANNLANSSLLLRQRRNRIPSNPTSTNPFITNVISSRNRPPVHISENGWLVNTPSSRCCYSLGGVSGGGDALVLVKLVCVVLETLMKALSVSSRL